MGHRCAELFDDVGSMAQRLREWQDALAAYDQPFRTAPPTLAKVLLGHADYEKLVGGAGP
jgi:hypothetical protein